MVCRCTSTPPPPSPPTSPPARVALRVCTDYPHSGRIEVPHRRRPGYPDHDLLRVPSWAEGSALTVGGTTEAAFRGPRAPRVCSVWATPFVLDLPMAPRFTAADPRIDAVRCALAIERGPLVLCAESVDLPGERHVDDLVLDPSRPPEDVDGGVQVHGWLRRHVDDPWPYGAPATAGNESEPVTVVLHPYAGWAERGPSTMRVFIPVPASNWRRDMAPRGLVGAGDDRRSP